MLDVDICGPSIPRLMGLDGEQVLNILYKLLNRADHYGYQPVSWWAGWRTGIQHSVQTV